MSTNSTEWLSPAEVIRRLPFSKSSLYRFLEENSTTAAVRVSEPPTAGTVDLESGDLGGDIRTMEVKLCPPLGGCSLPGTNWHFHEPTVEGLREVLCPREGPTLDQSSSGEVPCD